MTVRLDNKLAEQSAPICQIRYEIAFKKISDETMEPIKYLLLYRLDFVSMTIAPPTAGTCTDTFQVGGATTVAPTICGTNAGQHSK
jgi:hypothetical protein